MPSFSVWFKSNTSIWKSRSTFCSFLVAYALEEKKNPTTNQSKLEQAGQTLEKTRNQRQPEKENRSLIDESVATWKHSSLGLLVSISCPFGTTQKTGSTRVIVLKLTHCRFSTDVEGVKKLFIRPDPIRPNKAHRFLTFSFFCKLAIKINKLVKNIIFSQNRDRCGQFSWTLGGK